MSTDCWVHPIIIVGVNRGCLGSLSPRGGNICPVWLQSPDGFKSVCWRRWAPTHPYIHTQHDEKAAPIALRNPDKNNVALGSLCGVWVRWLQGSRCLLRGVGISDSIKELAKESWHSRCWLSMLQPTFIHGQQKKKKAGKITFIRLFTWHVPHNLNNLFYRVFLPRWQARGRAY